MRGYKNKWRKLIFVLSNKKSRFSNQVFIVIHFFKAFYYKNNLRLFLNKIINIKKYINKKVVDIKMNFIS